MFVPKRIKKFEGEDKICIRVTDISTWKEDTVNVDSHSYFKDFLFKVNDEINSKVSIYAGNIVSLEVDAIVNTADHALAGSSGVDAAVHRAAGNELTVECSKLGGCTVGNAKITQGYALPAKYVIHTVPPIGEHHRQLQQCYEYCLFLIKENNFRTAAFPSVSPTAYMYPREKAAHVALKAVRDWIQINSEFVTRIVFCLLEQTDIDIYNRLMHLYFPVQLKERED